MSDKKIQNSIKTIKEIDHLIKPFFIDEKITENFNKEENSSIKSQLIILIQKVTQSEKTLSRKNSKIIESIIEDHNVNTEALSNIILIDFNSKVKNFYKEKKQNDFELLNLFNDKKIIFFLHKGIVTNIYTELFLIQIRRELLKKYSSNLVIDPKFNKTALPIIMALANQCFNNEYIWHITNEERQNIEKILARVNYLIKNDNKIPNSFIGLLCCYQNFSSHQILLNYFKEEKYDDILKELIQKQFIDINNEKEIVGKIESLTQIDNEVSLKVMDQYESNPYPRWLNLNKGPSYLNYIEYIKTILPRQNTFSDKIDAKNVLIAGCGTGKHPLEVSKIDPSLKITAIDISKPSIAYGIRKSKELGIKNIKWAHADILKLDSLNKEFDIIESSGVIHHLEKPIQGFNMLDKKLKKGGLLKLGLYARRFRSIYLDDIRKHKNQNKFTNDIESIRKLRLFLINNIQDSKYQKIFKIPDIYNASGFRDLIMHVQEHDFSIPDINKMISNKYKFLGFFWNSNNAIIAYKTFERIFPNKNKLNILDWDVVEEEVPEIFSGMYQFWLQKKL